MDKNLFWRIIDTVNSQVAGDDYDGIIRVTQEELLKHSPEDIARWGGIQRCYRDLADTGGIFAVSCILNDYMSDDGFMDFRMWLISRGKEVYMAALKNPDSLAALNLLANIQETMETRFESYGYVANYAYEKTDIEIDFYTEMDSIHPMSPEEEADLGADIQLSPHKFPNQNVVVSLLLLANTPLLAAGSASLPRLLAKYITPEDFGVRFTNDIYTSSSFQCDTTDGFPTVLRVDWAEEHAWLEPAPFYDEDDEACQACIEACRVWGLRSCPDWQEYNALAEWLGEEAYQAAAVEIEDQSMDGMTMQ